MFSVGRIADPSEDRYPTSGAHLDIRVIPMYGDQKGQKIDPALRPELLGRFRFGEGENLTTLGDYRMTSPFGPRVAPVPGASTNHLGIDYAIGAGVPISFAGPGSYYSQNGVGVITTTDSKGNPYELELFHTVPGADLMAPPEGSPASKSHAIQAEAKDRAQSYAQMSKSQLDAAYDANRDSAEGLKMHKAFFKKP